MGMNIYKTKPIRGNAKKAWEYFCHTQGSFPTEMYYSREHIDGARWVAYYSSSSGYGSRQHYYYEIESCSLDNWCNGKFNYI